MINETVDDAVQVKRMKKKIHELEGQLESQKKQIDVFQKNGLELKMLQQVLIQAPKSMVVSNAQRRRTWAGGQGGFQPISDFTNGLSRIEDKIEEEATSDVPISGDQMAIFKLKFDDDGRHVEYQNGDWNRFLDDTVARMAELNDFDLTGASEQQLSTPAKTPALLRNPARRSLLKTPKSCKNILNRGKCGIDSDNFRLFKISDEKHNENLIENIRE